MLLKKNIWLIFYLLIFLGLLFVGASTFATWSDIRLRTAAELSYFNRIFSATVSATMDQREIMLELIGQQLLQDQRYASRAEATTILDRLLRQNDALVGMALANTEGELIAASSNINMDRMPNLRDHASTQETFAMAVDKTEMVLGATYFLEALDSWVIPFRKSIRAADGQVLGIMATGIEPGRLLPQLNEIAPEQPSSQIQVALIYDYSFRYIYFSGLRDHDAVREILANPVPPEIIEQHRQALLDQTGKNLESIRQHPQSVEYQASALFNETRMYSLLYLPKYRMWSLAFLPRQQMLSSLVLHAKNHLLAMLLFAAVLFLLVRHIDRSEKNRRLQLLDQANRDFLTGLKNRQYLQWIEPDWINQPGNKFSVLFIDLDNFKNINDSYGHSYGDAILSEVAVRLKSIKAGRHLICRQGGDEFIILTEKTGQKFLQGLALDILARLSSPFAVVNFQFTIGASIGICRYPEDGASFEDLFSAADTAMYHAKHKRNNYFIFTEELRQQTQQKLEIEQALHSAVTNDEFHMVYQPQVTSRGRLFGVEALVRWRHDSLGLVAPNVFIPIAEDCGRIIDLGHFIIERSIRDIAAIEDSNDYYNLQLSINISVRQLLERGFLESLTEVLNRYKYPSRLLTLEITESLFIDDFDYVLPLLRGIREMGISISLDDFGTGYSSLSLLNRLPIDELKIDRSFINNITTNPRDKLMVLNIMNIAQGLGLRVVAEGIETEVQSLLLNRHQCDIQQGYLHSRPLEFSDLVEYFIGFTSPAKSA